MKAVLISLLLAANAWGQSSSTLKIDEALKNKKFEDTHEITDSKLRAEAGSFSRYSFKFDLTYLGAAVATPLAKEQPNPDNIRRVTATSLTGSIAGRFRLDSTSSLGLGTGLSALHPFHGTDRWDVKTPYVSYDHFDRYGEYQTRLSTGLTVETVPDNISVGMVGGPNLMATVMRDLGTSGFSVGVDGLIFYKVFNRDFDSQGDGYGAGKIPRHMTIISPLLKYSFSDDFSLSSSVSKPFMNPRSVRSEWTMLPLSLTQKLSVGYAYSKVIYISPYVGFYPERFAWNSTTLNISGIFSVM